jgi:NADH-quinone oxidoreductase subunit G
MSADPKDVVEMVNIEVDGVAMEAPKNSMIIEATDRAGIDVPRFCYHRKLTIAANCRMCLVDVEKAPKPMPACATPVMEGMKIYTQSRRAVDAQHGVMEFLLINHPLDCPICDQGGECELQDLAMGYGRSVSRFAERKRVVKDKNAGPLIQTDMTRCIHCTRCVRFLEEIAGTSEMGGSGRGDRLEIGTCIEKSIDSEVSGNIIDVCPVGALTNKPFRFSARAWELVAQPSTAMHDGLGSSLYYHNRRGEILRAVPAENEAVNETWLSDRDRYSHFGLNADDRVLEPMVKENGDWRTVSWEEAIGVAAEALRNVVESDGADQLGVLMSSSAMTEEYFLAQRLARSLGSNNIDHRLREVDFSDDPSRPTTPVFAAGPAEIEQSDVILLIGSNIRHEAPILGHRVRKAWGKGAVIAAINPLDYPFHFSLNHKTVVAPQHMVSELTALASAVAKLTDSQLPAGFEAVDATEEQHNLARVLVDGERGVLLLGQLAMSHPQAASLRLLAEWLAATTGYQINLLPHGGNPVGAWRAGAIPHRAAGGTACEAGLNAREMLETPRKAYLLWGFEPDFDVSNPALAESVLAAAEKVIAVTSFATGHLADLADVILPLAPAAQAEGSMLRLDGEMSQIRPAGRPSGACKSGWKILRRLGDELGLDGFDQIDLSGLQAEMNEVCSGEAERADALAASGKTQADGLHRIGEVPMYGLDALCRRSEALQQTVHAQSGFVGLNPTDAGSLNLSDGDKASIDQGGKAIELPVRVSTDVPEGAAWLRSSTCSSRELGDSFGPITVKQNGGDS